MTIRNHSILPALLRLAAYLTLFYLLLIGLSVLLGSGNSSAPIIAFTRSENINPYQFKSNLYIMDIRSTLPIKTSDQPIACCVFWSPDGTRIAFNGENSLPFVWDMRDGTTRPLAEPDFFGLVTAWSPDSQSVLMGTCTSPQQPQIERLCHVQPEGSNMIFFDIPELDTGYSLQIADWSRDNQWIVYTARDIYRIRPDGTNQQQLTQIDKHSYGARISPDGTQISFISLYESNVELYLMDVDGGNLEQLTTSTEFKSVPVWSPDSKYILYQTAEQGTKIHLINVETRAKTEFIYDLYGQGYSPPVWSPDGKHILFEMYANPGSRLYMIDADGGNLRLLAEEHNMPTLNASWQPQP